MDDHEDPSVLFFGTEEVDLYKTLGVQESSTPDEIKKAYRKLALVYHPDKHAGSSEDARAAAAQKFQQIGFAYAVLSVPNRRSKYDRTGRTDEGFEDVGEDGWETYFADLFEQVTKERLDDMKREYQGSEEELEDLKAAYNETGGSIEEIMRFIPHSTHDDEARFIVTISSLIAQRKLPALALWETSTKDEKARLVRKKQADKEAAEAEELARELGVWDEFYGSGKAGPRKGKGKGGKKVDDDGEDVSTLQALILKKQKGRADLFDNLAAKYAKPEKKSNGKGKQKKREPDGDEMDESPRKKTRATFDIPDIDDEEFERLQKELFGTKARKTGENGTDESPRKKKRGAADGSGLEKTNAKPKTRKGR